MKKMMIKAISGLMLLALTVSALTGCGGKGDDGELTWKTGKETVSADTTGTAGTAPVTPAGDALLTLPASDREGHAAVSAMDLINGLKAACGITVNTSTESVIIMTYKTCFIAIEVGSSLSITDVSGGEGIDAEFSFLPYSDGNGNILVDAGTLAGVFGCSIDWNRDEGKVTVFR